MQKKYLYLASLLALTAIVATGCKKKEETPAVPTEQTLTAVTVNDLQAGSYYVKNAGDFYELPLEGISFDATKAVTSTDDTGNGMTGRRRTGSSITFTKTGRFRPCIKMTSWCSNPTETYHPLCGNASSTRGIPWAFTG